MSATRKPARLLAVGLVLLLPACSTPQLPKSLFIVPQRYVNAGMLAGRAVHKVKRLDQTISFGRAHLEGPISLDLNAALAVNKYLDEAIVTAGADAVTNLEMTYYDLLLPSGFTAYAPVKADWYDALDGWVGIPVFGIYVHVAWIRLEGDLVTIEDGPRRS